MDAESTASNLLGAVGTRLAHSISVAHQASIVAPMLAAPWNAALVPAAWLHDVGYAPDLRLTDFHPLDGARWLRANGWQTEVCCLVAWHTRAETEAEMRMLLTEMGNEFPKPPYHARVALVWADLTSSPLGVPCTAAHRIDEILGRYPETSIVHRATVANRSALLADAAEVESMLSVIGDSRP
jgi:hypothetical protein